MNGPWDNKIWHYPNFECTVRLICTTWPKCVILRMRFARFLCNVIGHMCDIWVHFRVSTDRQDRYILKSNWRVQRSRGESWQHGMKRRPILLAPWKKNPPLASGFTSKRGSHLEFWCFHWYYPEHYWPISRISRELKCHDAHVISL